MHMHRKFVYYYFSFVNFFCILYQSGQQRSIHHANNQIQYYSFQQKTRLVGLFKEYQGFAVDYEEKRPKFDFSSNSRPILE